MAAINFPSSPTQGQIFTANSRTFIWDGVSWNASTSGYAGSQGNIGYTGSAGTNGNIGYTGSAGAGANLLAVSSNIVPTANVTYDLGTADNRWRDIYLSGNTINMNGATISTGSDGFVFRSPTGNVSFNSNAISYLANVSAGSVSSGIGFTSSLSVPTSPTDGDFWFNTTRSSLYQYANVGIYSSWIELTLPAYDFGISSSTSAEITQSQSLQVEYLLVAGGGGGGRNGGGGGGGGGYVTGLAPIQLSTVYNVVIGAGGAKSSSDSATGTDGSLSSVFGVSSVGGGAGTSRLGGGPGHLGGSGGGAAGPYTNQSCAVPGNGTAGQGQRGGYGSNTDSSGVWTGDLGGPATGGGGGGGGFAGGKGASNLAGNGGDGLQWIDGNYYAGGGGGGITDSGLGGLGGLGGGGVGHAGRGSAYDGTANTGGGGGGGSANGNGGSGIVIIRSSQTATSTTGSPTVTVVGQFTYYKFTATGSITF